MFDAYHPGRFRRTTLHVSLSRKDLNMNANNWHLASVWLMVCVRTP